MWNSTPDAGMTMTTRSSGARRYTLALAPVHFSPAPEPRAWRPNATTVRAADVVVESSERPKKAAYGVFGDGWSSRYRRFFEARMILAPPRPGTLWREEFLLLLA